MFALLPIIGGVLLGWLAPRRIAVILQVVLYVVAATVLVLTAPDHGATYVGAWPLVAGLAVVSVGTLYLGFFLGRRRRSAQA